MTEKRLTWTLSPGRYTSTQTKCIPPPPNMKRNIIRVSIGLDPDKNRRTVGPDLGPNYLKMLSATDKSRHK